MTVCFFFFLSSESLIISGRVHLHLSCLVPTSCRNPSVLSKQLLMGTTKPGMLAKQLSKCPVALSMMWVCCLGALNNYLFTLHEERNGMWLKQREQDGSFDVNKDREREKVWLTSLIITNLIGIHEDPSEMLCSSERKWRDLTRGDEAKNHAAKSQWQSVPVFLPLLPLQLQFFPLPLFWWYWINWCSAQLLQITSFIKGKLPYVEHVVENVVKIYSGKSFPPFNVREHCSVLPCAIWVHGHLK